MTDVLGCVGGAAFILFASAVIPFFGPFFCLLTPLPFLFYSTKLGLQEGIKLAVLAVCGIGLVAKLAGYPQIIPLGIELSALGLALAGLFKSKFGVGQTVLFATVFVMLLSLGYLIILGLSKDMGPFEMMLDYLHGHIKATIESYEKMGMPRENAIELETYGKLFIDTVYPSLMIVGVGFAVWLNVVMAKPFFRMGNLRYPEFVPMDRWQTPDVMIYGVIISGFAFFLFSGAITSVAANVLIVLMVIYIFHGLSIILFFFNKYRLPSWIRIGVYLLIIIQQFFLILLALAGVFDQWADFRRLHRESEA
jgi:uncharacterized protein YybS (DUF2232 family)